MFGVLSSLLAALLSWWRGRDKLAEMEARDVATARMQSEIVADRTRPDAADVLRSGEF